MLIATDVQGVIYLVLHRHLVHIIQLYIVVFVLQKMCEACMLHSRIIMQAFRWVVEIATQKNVK